MARFYSTSCFCHSAKWPGDLSVILSKHTSFSLTAAQYFWVFWSTICWITSVRWASRLFPVQWRIPLYVPPWEVCDFNCLNYPSGVILVCLPFLSTIILYFGNCTRIEQTRYLIRKRIAPSRLRSLEENDLPTVVFADCTELGQHVSFIIHLMGWEHGSLGTESCLHQQAVFSFLLSGWLPSSPRLPWGWSLADIYDIEEDEVCLCVSLCVRGSKWVCVCGLWPEPCSLEFTCWNCLLRASVFEGL